jgi:hypothetical protein
VTHVTSMASNIASHTNDEKSGNTQYENPHMAADMGAVRVNRG